MAAISRVVNSSDESVRLPSFALQRTRPESTAATRIPANGRPRGGSGHGELPHELRQYCFAEIFLLPVVSGTWPAMTTTAGQESLN
jgi:hypothetical protein